MAYTYSQINIHAVFTVLGRENLISPAFRGHLFGYISETMKGIGVYPLAVNGTADHVHIFFELPPNISVSKALQEIKTSSSRWINNEGLVPGKFQWQKGFGAFTNSRSQRDSVIKYILNQELHHAKNSFRDEYIELLQKYSVDFNPNNLFEFYVQDSENILPAETEGRLIND
ncbi:MAG TPA: IS200/IS605 family transposase [Bacteroidales bacterium]|nr:IS200/IS605 family transposase [Bacteroidales bacterium]